MGTIKTIGVLGLLMLSFACSNSDDDNDSPETPSTANLLISGKWYLESKTPNDFSACEKNGSLQFHDDGSVEQENYEENSGTCEATDLNSATYTLSGSSLVITFGSDTITTTINSITDSELSITDSNGDTIILDKTQG
ncbi:lipocalin family protein [Maribacter polysiphoniae]|uniref:Lipocalin family protein n=1 Tax=Maribacter polysiphoniae TaxID=429344 RepID=A0A316E642_9FLAO|nr:lipocalin family protein [Maribacter polysiphoniae]MBD1260094.1 lipocalin family protein [Maribacter polysiphoniae]PWK25555.1 lipocalin-like protein [Maribacter polysiphoniae]